MTFFKIGDIFAWFNTIIRIIFTVFFTIAFSPIYLPLAVFFVAYRKCIEFILSKKLGEKFGGLLSGGDQFYATEKEVVNGVVNVLLMVDSADNDFSGTVKRYFKIRCFDAPERLAKFTGVRKQAFGYFYVLKDEYGVDECVREVQDELRDEDDLQEIFNKHANSPLPKNHTAFWEVLVCKSAIKWNDSRECFPVIIRCHHSIADGTNLFHALSKFLNDDPLIPQSKPIVPKLTKIQKTILFLKKILFDAFIMIQLPSFLLMNVLLKRPDSNSFTAKELSKKTTLTWRIQDGEIITKIKKIKNKIPGTTFTDVLLAATSATFEEHMSKSDLEVPENFTVIYPINFNSAKIYEKAPVLINNVAGFLLPIPIRWKSNSLIDKLKEVSRRQVIAKSNNAVHGYYWLSSILPHYLPLALIQPKNLLSITLSFSNIQRAPYSTMFGGHIVDLITCGNHICTSGMTLIFFNYGGERLQLGLSVDKALINSVEEMNDILDGFGKYVNVMYQELK